MRRLLLWLAIVGLASSSSDSYYSNSDSDSDGRHAMMPGFPMHVSVPVISVLMVTSLIICGIVVIMHSVNYVHPITQRFLIRIVLVVPVFSILSFLTFILWEFSPFFNVAQDLYEAYALLCFFSLLVAYCGDVKCLSTCLADKLAPTFKCCCCFTLTTPTPPRLVRFAKISIFQFMIIKPLISVASVVFMFVFPLRKLEVAMRLAALASLIFAMWTLLMFFRVISKCLSGLNTLQIFLWLKGLIFLLVVQEAVVDMAFQRGLIMGNSLFAAGARARRFAAFLCLIECLAFSIAAPIVFSYKMYKEKRLRGDVAPSVLRGRGLTARVLILECLKDVSLLWILSGGGCPHPKPLDTLGGTANTSALIEAGLSTSASESSGNGGIGGISISVIPGSPPPQHIKNNATPGVVESIPSEHAPSPPPTYSNSHSEPTTTTKATSTTTTTTSTDSNL
ncbi:transmembrane protein 184A [Pelomyxa schiedti]|nr:transmembrane protein 184A [Pelomyxa schiedti]